MSTQTQGGRGAALRGYRRRKAVLDLNEPPTEGRFDEGTSAQVAAPVVQASERPQSLRPTMIDVEALDDDVEALDDDVVESSARAFAEAKTNALRAGKRPLVVDLDSGRTNGLPQNNHNKRSRGLSSQTVINSGLCINIDDSNSSRMSTAQLQAPTPAPPVPAPAPPPPPPTEPIFCCPICMGPFAEATSTKCGHIFCLTCIKKALATAKSPTCPTCRKKVSKRGLIRVFLPSIS